MSYSPSGVALAMVAFDASSGTPTVTTAFNGTLTDDGVGLYTVNLTVPAADANYVAVGNARHTTTSGTVWREVRYRRQATASKAAGSIAIQVINQASTALADAPEISCTVYGVPS